MAKLGVANYENKKKAVRKIVVQMEIVETFFIL